VLAACAAPKVQRPPPTAQPALPILQAPEAALEAPETPVEEPGLDTAVTEIELDAPTKIGLLLPLSGQHGRVGRALLNAAQLALFDIAGERFALVVRDTRGTPEGAREAADSAIGAGVRLILGPLFATSVAAVGPQAGAAGINVITFSNDRTIAGDGVFVMGFAPDAQIERVVGYASSQGLVRFAVLAPQTPYGNAVVDALREAVLRYGVELSRVVSYGAGTTDLSAEVRALADYDVRREALLVQRQMLAARDDETAKLALKRLDGLETLGPPDFDAVVLPEGGKRLQAIAPLLAYFDVDPAEVRFLGTALWDDARLGAEPTLAGGWFAAPSREHWGTFAARYRETYGSAPPRIAPLAYDATALAAVLARRAQDAAAVPDFGAGALIQPGGFSGIDGIFRFLPDGMVQRSLAVLQIERDAAAVLDEAPRSFEALAY
jgi:ABC-type branched-subunit amino acid transport system substrate-binding protein